MKITVILPFKNEEAVLERSLGSLARQEGDFQFILVDDMSTDKSNEIADKFADRDERFIVLDNTGKGGVSSARNKGLSYATGDWITFLDADDELNEDAYKIFNNAIEALGDDVNVFQFNHYRYYTKIDKLALKYTNPAALFSLPELPLFWCMAWNKLYKAEILKGVRFEETMQFAEDEMFNLNVLAKDSRIMCVNAVTTTRYFDNQNRLSKIKTDKDILKLNDALVKFVKKHDDPALRRAVCLRLSEHWSHLFLDILGGDSNA